MFGINEKDKDSELVTPYSDQPAPADAGVQSAQPPVPATPPIPQTEPTPSPIPPPVSTPPALSDSPLNSFSSPPPPPSDLTEPQNPSGLPASIGLDNSQPPPEPPAPSPAPDSSSLPPASNLLSKSSSDELLKMKQQALQSLAPLVDHLDQTPEEKFKTTMMMIQAADNKELIQEAFDAANEIPDDKARAQALLDVVNEINYFTHQQSDSSEKPAASS